MARGEVFIEDERGSIRAWRTDLTGHGNVRIGEEFTVRDSGSLDAAGSSSADGNFACVS
jgi:hypothetical protein